MLLGLTVLVTLLLAAGLSSLSFPETQPVWLGDLKGGQANQHLASDPAAFMWLRVFLAIVVIMTPVALIYLVATREGRKRLLGLVLIAALSFLCLTSILPRIQEQKGERPTEEVVLDQDDRDSGFVPTGGDFDPAQTPDWLVTAVGVVLAVIIASIATVIVLFLVRRRQPSPIEQISQQAQAAVDELEAGGDFKDIIIRCYSQMSRVLQKERSLTREQAMTPREFEGVLVRKGFPGEPVHTLTSLFETARYSFERPSGREVQRAVTSLNAIVAYCRETASSS